MQIYRTLTLKTVYPQLHNTNRKLCMKVRPLENLEEMNIQAHMYLEPGTRLEPGDIIIYADNGLLYEISFLKGR